MVRMDPQFLSLRWMQQRKTKNGNAIGGGGLAVELLESLNGFTIDKITRITNLMYDNGSIAEQMTQSLFIAITMITITLEYNKHRTINIMGHIAKINLRVVITRVRSKSMPELSVKHLGFLP